MTNRVLVTGGLGFMGSHLVRRLATDAHPPTELTIVDDLSGTPSDWAALEAELASILDDKVTIIIDDVRALRPSEAEFDHVWHLASPVGSVGILGSTGRIAGDIIDIAGHVHDVAAASNASLLYVSSSEVYGRDGRHDEGADLVVADRRGARMEYAIGKLGAEHVLYNRAVDSGVRLHMVRPFNCAGPGQSRQLGFVIPTFVEAALHGRSLPVHGDGSARRAFCHVGDLVEGIVAVHDRGEPGRVYNIGQPDGVVSILELAELIIGQLDSPSEIEFVDPAREHGDHWLDAFDKTPDIGLVTAHTSWRPTLELEQIIDDVVDAMGEGGW